MKKEDAVAVFDSGLGGISVLRVLREVLPNEDFIYYGDSANAPYGQRTAENIQKLCAEVVRKLMQNGIKCVVIACNTATSAALETLREEFPDMKFIGTEPAVSWAAAELPDPTVLTFATNFTIHGERYQNSVKALSGKGTFYGIGAPELVTFVESGVTDRHMTAECVAYIDRLLSGIKEPVDAVVLGCTHFPFMKETIRQEADRMTGGHAVLFDGAYLTAKETREWLSKEGLLRERIEKGSVTLLNSDPSKAEMMKMLFEA